MTDDRFERLLALQKAAKRIADPNDVLGQRARLDLPSVVHLSPASVEFALRDYLEHSVSRSTLSALVKRTQRLRRSHVSLSANVFTAPFRAIALALCQSPQVDVRPSRRAPLFTHLLHEGSEGAFDLVDELRPESGDALWAYGSDETLTNLRATLPSGIRLHAHGFGMGAAVFRENPGASMTDLPMAVSGLAQDTVVFDQRGCLSPRVVLVEGSRYFAETICDLLVGELSDWQKRVPRGELSPDERADALRHEGTMTYLGGSVVAGMGLVSLDPQEGRVLIPPVGRYLHVCVCNDALPLLQKLGPKLTTISLYNAGHLPGLLRDKIGERRVVDMGQMQKPAFDGPVDLRHGWESETV